MNVRNIVQQRLFVAATLMSLAAVNGCSGATTSALPGAPQGSLQQTETNAPSVVNSSSVRSSLGMTQPQAPTLFAPSDIANLSAWYDASDASSMVETASKLAVWRDKSGNGNDVAPANTASAPSVSGFGTSSAVIFDGTSFLVGKNASFSQNLFNEASVFMVTNQSSAAQTSTLVWSGSYLSNPRFNIRLSEAGASHFDLNNKSDGRLAASDVPTGTSLWSALGSYSGHAQSFSKNGAIIAHDGGPATSVTGNWPLAIGATYDSSSGRTALNFNGQIKEILIFHRALTPAQGAQAEGYLACKWSLQAQLPSTHPYHTVCPGAPPSPAPTSPPTTAPSPRPGPASGPMHVLTAEYFKGNSGYYGPASTMAHWANWATGGGGVSEALAAGLETYEYADPWIAYAADNGAAWNDIKPGGAHAAAEAKTCGGVPIGANNGTSTIFTDPTQTTAALGHYENSINYWQAEEGTNTTAMFMDDVANQEYAANKPACNYSAQAWLTGAQTMAAGVAPTRIIANGLINAEYTNDEMSIVPLLNVPNVMGGMYEDCYGFNGSEGMGGGDHSGGLRQHWTITENTELAALATGKIFWCYSNMRDAGSADIGLRLYAYANFLLTYSTNALYQTAMSTPSGLRVFPETGIVPTNPLVPAPSSVSSLQTSTGAYGREYANCYYRGAPIGACAIVTNPDNGSSHNNPFSGYLHAAILTGAGVLDGGSVSFSGSVPASLAPLTAAIMTR